MTHTPRSDSKAYAHLVAAAPETAAERDRLKAINAELLKALGDIAGGIGPADEMPSLDNPPDVFQSGMWGWSQRRARAAITKYGPSSK